MTLNRKAIILGLDGATWTLLRPWIDQGHLPHLARLVHEGASGPLTTTIPPVSASAWVSLATGCNPGKHGAFDFVFPQPGGYDIGVINVKVRGVPPFWKTIEEAGGQVGLMSMPITYPPQPHQRIYRLRFSGAERTIDLHLSAGIERRTQAQRSALAAARI